MLQCVAWCCSVLHGVCVCVYREARGRQRVHGMHFKRCSIFQSVTECCSVLQCVAVCGNVLPNVEACCSVLQSVTECCSVLQSASVCCIVLHSVAVCVCMRAQGSKRQAT